VTEDEVRRRIFLSYRRDDCLMHAGRLAENLRERAGAEVFLDIDTIGLGENFVKRIEREISRCDMVLVMIGDEWLNIIGRDGKPRIQDPVDFIYLEIKTALERDVPVIPVLVEGTSMPRPEDLPEELRELALRNGAELRVESWPQDFERLAGALPGPARAHVGGETPSSSAKTRASIDFVVARGFIESIPRGRWTSYGEVAKAAGAPRGAMAIGNWLLARGEDVPNVWRVLTNKGEVAGGWAPKDPDLPQSPDAVRDLLGERGSPA
jgi:hypothetical protein